MSTLPQDQSLIDFESVLQAIKKWKSVQEGSGQPPDRVRGEMAMASPQNISLFMKIYFPLLHCI